MRLPSLTHFLFALLIGLPLVCSGQISLVGITRDSSSLHELPYVNVSIGKRIVAISGERGLFELNCNAGDTVFFSLVGYNTARLIPLKSEKNFSVILTEATTVLNNVTIYGNYKPQGKDDWSKYIRLPGKFENQTMKAPDQMVQTFGPGTTLSGLLSYFSSDEKEKRKMKKATDYLVATGVYREVMSSEKVKTDLMEMFSLSEEQYFKKIEAFNIQNPDASRLKNRDEIINMLIQFFALKEK
jgi:hypothetical protein